MLLAAGVVISALLAFGGGGSSESEPSNRGPQRGTFDLPDPPAAEPAALDAEEPVCLPAREARRSRRGRDVRIAGLDGEAQRRPRTLQIAREIELRCLVWESFGGREATASGVTDELDCIPTCAQSGVKRRMARLRVSGLRRCGGRRFYSRMDLLLGVDEDTDRPRTFPVVPCNERTRR